jgi:hypothetical protein
MSNKRILLVGDNPFHGVSHLSQERAGSRGKALINPEYAAELVITSAENGAEGFMFTVNEMTLSILRVIGKRRDCNQSQLYALVPDAREFVRVAGVAGGVVGLAKNLAKEIVFSLNFRAATNGLRGMARADRASLLKSYLSYEVFRVKSAAGKKATVASLLLHEVVTDMALALNMDWLFKTHIDFMKSLGIKPGFETRNFSYLVKKFEEWGIGFRGITIAAPFNPIGFQMCPSREEWEETLVEIPEAEVIAFSILAGGYLKLPEAIEYVANLPTIRGVAVGVSKKEQAYETFKLLKERL